VLHDAYAENEKMVAPVELSPHERDVEAAQRQAEALNATFAQREKLRAIITERRDAQRELAAAQETLVLAQETITSLRQERFTLLNEQIVDGSDSRLDTFWANAQEKASDENYCGEFDRMAELLGGHRRNYAVTVSVTFDIIVNIEAQDEDTALEDVNEMNHSDIENVIGDLSAWQINLDSFEATGAEQS